MSGLDPDINLCQDLMSGSDVHFSVGFPVFTVKYICSYIAKSYIARYVCLAIQPDMSGYIAENSIARYTWLYSQIYIQSAKNPKNWVVYIGITSVAI